ncbi:MAG: glycosyltransferase family 2 protein [Butyrivibrio sp.]|nr:glycosyltransferase family 2 protein [Butyrivibrio sp.]
MSEILYIVIPAYNESENIQNVINDWYPVIESHSGDGKSRLVIVNDGSKDNTYDIICEAAKTHPYLQPLTKENGGHGPAILFGYKYALENGADFIFQTDSDGQTNPDEFEQFWNERTAFDMLIGWRQKREDGSDRVFVTKTLKVVIKMCFGVDVTDANTPYRLMRSSTLSKYIGIIPDDFFLSNVVISVIFAKKNLRVKYIPISFRPRQGGVNSINFKKIIGIGSKALKDFKVINKKIDEI